MYHYATDVKNSAHFTLASAFFVVCKCDSTAGMLQVMREMSREKAKRMKNVIV